jgi:hypothetical protein
MSMKNNRRVTVSSRVALATTLALALIGAPLVAAADDAAPQGPDLAKEERWRSQIVDSLMDGDAVDLTADGVTFLGLYTEADEGTGVPGAAR